MLKIKDNVYLKELEKYGFKLKYNEDNGKPFSYENTFINWNSAGNITIYIEDREINHHIDYRTEDEIIDTLYDLIKDGLVEKVEEE